MVSIVYEKDTWSQDLKIDFTLKSSLLGSVKLTKNADPNKCKYSGYGIGFDSRSLYLLTDNTTRRIIIIFGAEVNSSVDIDNKGKDIVILGDGPTQRSDDTLTAEAIYFINYTQSNRKVCLCLHCNGNSSFLFVKVTKIYHFKAKDSKTKKISLVFRNVPVDFPANSVIKSGLDGTVYDFSVDSSIILLSINI